MIGSSESNRDAISVVKEEMTINKKKKITGAVRLETIVHKDEMTVDEPLRVEEIHVERVPVDRWVDGPVAVRQEGDTTVVSVLAEVTVVEKRLKVVEEVRLTKRTTTRRSPERVVLRREEAIVERLGTPPDDGGPKD